MNANTIVNALQAIKGGGSLKMQLPATSDSKLVYFNNALTPLVLSVPNDPNAGIKVGAPLSGVAEEGMWWADGKSFLVRAAGTVAPITASGVLRLVLSVGTGVAGVQGIPGAVSDIVLASVSATLPASNPYDSNWYLEAKCMWDSTSNTLNGYLCGQIAGTLIDLVAFKQANLQISPLPFLLGTDLSLQAGVSINPVITLTDFSADMK